MLDRNWGGVEADPPDNNFQSPVWGSSSTSGGLNPPNPPTNRTLALASRGCTLIGPRLLWRPRGRTRLRSAEGQFGMAWIRERSGELYDWTRLLRTLFYRCYFVHYHFLLTILALPVTRWHVQPMFKPGSGLARHSHYNKNRQADGPVLD